MKILGICCSPRKGQNTYKAMRHCLAAAGDVGAGIETEIIELAGKRIGPCIACNICRDGLVCGLEDDFNDLIDVLADKDVAAMIIGTPVYFLDMTAQCKAFLDRCVMFRRNGWVFRDRVGGVFAVGGARNGGQELTCRMVHAAMLCHDMICVGDGRDTGHVGGTLWSNIDGGLDADDFGLQTVRNLGRRVAEVARKLHAAP